MLTGGKDRTYSNNGRRYKKQKEFIFTLPGTDEV